MAAMSVVSPLVINQGRSDTAYMQASTQYDENGSIAEETRGRGE